MKKDKANDRACSTLPLFTQDVQWTAVNWAITQKLTLIIITKIYENKPACGEHECAQSHTHSRTPLACVDNNAVVSAAVLSVINKSLGSYGID